VSLLFPMLAASDQNGDGDHSNNAPIGASSSAAAAHGHNLRIRIGIMSGPVIAGVSDFLEFRAVASPRVSNDLISAMTQACTCPVLTLW